MSLFLYGIKGPAAVKRDETFRQLETIKEVSVLT